MGHYIKDMIAQGEHQQLDFKFEISDSKKIARTFVAFANANGGKLLVGVKDNGKIAGVRTDEEYYMLEAAAEMYCKPSLPFLVETWDVDGKTVLEVTIAKSGNMPHSAPDPHGKYMVYVRVGDQNLLANTVLLKLWKRKKREKGTFIKYSKHERVLLDFLKENESITLSKFQKITKLPRFRAENIMVNLLSIQIIELKLTEKQALYTINKKIISTLDKELLEIE